ncbi:MAG TPA: AMP-binding protein [Xanthobacteraceae bacterium]|jgi:long-chain acyl-CoA synthetase|nr:AMP-binding protein [Xanthobacteraceae bacterium]
MTMNADRPFRWERSYPPGVRWDAPIGVTTLPALSDRATSQHADRIAFEFNDCQLSYRQFGELERKAAAGFLKLGIGKGAPLALYLPNSPFHPIALFGASRCGAKIVNLSTLDAEREIIQKLNDSGARTLVTTDHRGLLVTANKLLAAGYLDLVIVCEENLFGPSPALLEPFDETARCLSFKHLIESVQIPNRWPQINAADIALLQYTGGTTGTPKAAMLTHANLTAAASIYDAWFAPQRGPDAGPERVICVLPLSHIFGMSAVMLRHLKNGNEMLLRQRFDVETTLHDIEVKRATALPGVPTMWIALLQHPDIRSRDLSSLRFCSSGGAPLPPEVARRFTEITGVPVRGGYGMTESSPAGTNLPLAGELPAGTIGLPLPGITIEVVALDDPRRVLGPNETGEFRIKGPNVTQGYWNRPEESALAFVDGWFLTGDIGTMDDNGFFFLIDRKKQMIISSGFKIYPAVVEAAIYEHSDVEEAVVIGIPDDYRGEAAKAFVKLRPGAPPLTLELLRGFLRDKIGRQEMPVALELRNALPRTAVGKLSREALIRAECVISKASHRDQSQPDQSIILPS